MKRQINTAYLVKAEKTNTKDVCDSVWFNSQGLTTAQRCGDDGTTEKHFRLPGVLAGFCRLGISTLLWGRTM
jgi:hypothetical protein